MTIYTMTMRIPKHNFRNLLNIATKKTFVIFNNKYFKQVDGVAMALAPLGPALAKSFMCILKVNGFAIVLMISNLCSIDVISMICTVFFS